MLFWLIVFIGCAGLLKTWSAHHEAKFERERKLAKIQRQLERIEAKKATDAKRQNPTDTPKP